MNKEEIIKQLKKAIEEDGFYGWICDNGYLLSKDELIDIIKELDFSSYELGIDKKVENMAIEELKDRWGVEE